MLIQDASSYDATLNPSADGYIFRAIRTGGAIDSMLDIHVKGARNAGKPFGLYIFINFKRDIQTQINAINEQVTKYQPTLRTAIDIEQDSYDNSVIPANINDIAHACLNGVPNSFLYCNANMYETYLDNSFDNVDLWLAQYSSEPTKQYLHINVFARQYQEAPDLSTFDDRLIGKIKIVDVVQHIVPQPIVAIPQPVAVPQWNAEVYKVNSMPHEYNSTAGASFAIVGSNGVSVGDHKVDSGDKICIVNCLYDQQLLEIYYPISSGGFAHGFIKNDETKLHSHWYKAWLNGKTNEIVRDSSGKESGTIFPAEKATFLFKDNHGYFILFDTIKGAESKSGYAVYAGKLGF